MTNNTEIEELTPEIRQAFELAVFEEVGINLEPNDPVFCEAREIIITGGWRAGKSTRGAARVFRSILSPTTNGLIWLLGPDYPQTNEEFRYLFEWANHFGLMSRQPVMPTQGQKILYLKTGWKIETKSARYPEKLGSVAPNGILMCEPGQMSGEVYTMVIGRLAQKRGWMFAAGTIEDDSSHPKWTWYETLAREWMQHDDTYNTRAFSLPSWSNKTVFPGGENDPEIQRLRELYSDYTFKRRIAGEPVGIEHPCFPYLWEDEADLLKWADPEAMIDGAIGVDYGASPEHPSSCVAVTKDIFGTYWIRECWLETGGNVDAIALAVEGMKKRFKISKGRVDPHETVLAQRLNFNVAVGGGTYGVPTEYRVGIANGLLEDNYLKFDKNGGRIQEVFASLRRMRRIRDNKGRLTYDRELGDDAAQAALYALEELHGESRWLPTPNQYGGMRFKYLPSPRAGLVGRT